MQKFLIALKLLINDKALISCVFPSMKFNIENLSNLPILRKILDGKFISLLHRVVKLSKQIQFILDNKYLLILRFIFFFLVCVEMVMGIMTEIFASSNRVSFNEKLIDM